MSTISPAKPYGLPASVPTLADALAALGYATHGIGKWRARRAPQQASVQQKSWPFAWATGDPPLHNLTPCRLVSLPLKHHSQDNCIYILSSSPLLLPPLTGTWVSAGLPTFRPAAASALSTASGTAPSTTSPTCATRPAAQPASPTASTTGTTSLWSPTRMVPTPRRYNHPHTRSLNLLQAGCVQECTRTYYVY